jgi:predicted GNAT family acetyltransferase
MKLFKRKQKPMDAIHLVEDHNEVITKFKSVYAQEKLSCEPTKNTFWFVNEASCAALLVVTPNKFRIKGTVTRPEYRGQGYGSAMLKHLIMTAEVMAAGQKATIESFAKNPKWYLDNGFKVKRVTKWGVTVVEAELNGSNKKL